MKEVTLGCPEALESAFQHTAEELAAQMRLMAALKMFELGKLSSGKAVELAGLSRVEFLEACGRYRGPCLTTPLRNSRESYGLTSMRCAEQDHEH